MTNRLPSAAAPTPIKTSAIWRPCQPPAPPAAPVNTAAAAGVLPAAPRPVPFLPAAPAEAVAEAAAMPLGPTTTTVVAVAVAVPPPTREGLRVTVAVAAALVLLRVTVWVDCCWEPEPVAVGRVEPAAPPPVAEEVARGTRAADSGMEAATPPATCLAGVLALAEVAELA